MRNKKGFRNGFWPNSDPGFCSSNKGRFSKFYCMNILDNKAFSVRPGAPGQVQILPDPG